MTRLWSVLSLLAILASYAPVSLIPVTPASASTITLIGQYGPEASNVPAGQPTFFLFRDITLPYSYTSGVVTLSTCQTQACSFAVDDEVKLIVTRPDTTQASQTFVSNTHDLAAANITSLFQVGTNSIEVQLIDLMGPVRGLPHDLYLVNTASPPPPATLSQVTIPSALLSFRGPFTGTSSDPVNSLTGSYTYVHNDVTIASRGPALQFVRSYDSGNTLVGALGVGWMHNYEARLVSPAAMSNDVVFLGPQGRADRYVFSSGTYTAPAGVYSALVKNTDGTYKITEPNQTVWMFNEIGLLQFITDRFGNQSTLTYNGSNQLISVSDPAGRGVLTLGYTSGKLTSVTDWNSRAVNYGYDANGRLQTITDREGKVTTYGYDGTSQRLTTITDTNSHVDVTNTYDGSGRVATQKDAKGLSTGQQTTFGYVTNGDGTKTTTVTYPTTSFDSGWNFTEVDTYDTSGRLTQHVSKPTSVSGEWITEQYTYDANGNRTSYVDGRGNTTVSCYDVDYSGTAISGSRGNLTRVIAPPPTGGANLPVTLYQYDSKNNLTQMIPPKGVASGTTVTCTTNLSGALNLNYATTNAYDVSTQTLLLSSVRKFTDPTLGLQTATTKYEYGDSANPGLPTKIISPRGNTTGTPDYTYATVYTYTASGSKAGTKASVTFPEGGKNTYDYDSVGRTISMVDPNGNVAGGTPADHTWQYTYDNEDRRRFVKGPPPVSGGGQIITEYRYDAVGNQTSAIDPNGQVVKFLYDERDNLQETDQSPNTWTDPATTPTGKVVTAYQFDNLGYMTRVTRAQGDATYERVTDYVYDGFGRVRKETQYPSWPTTSPTLLTQYAYDKNGNRLTVVDPLTKTTTSSYDNLNRLTSINYASTTTPNVSYVYDADGNRTSMVDGTGTTSSTYDEEDHLLSVTSPGTVVVSHRYDLNGNRNKLIYPDSTVVTYNYDKADRMSSVVDWASRTTSYQYNSDNTPKLQSNANSTTAVYTYDNAARLTQIWNKSGTNTVDRYTYTLDSDGNKTQTDVVTVTGTFPGTITSSRQGPINFTLDRMYRLTHEAWNLAPSPATTQDYTYDPIGNRLTQTTTVGAPRTTTFTYDRSDRIKTASGNLTETYTVDANGNMTARGFSGANTAVFDQANRVIQAKPHTATYAYTYDGDGKRTKSQNDPVSPSVTVTYTYDTNRKFPVIIKDSSNKYVWGLGPLYYVDSTSTPYVYHTDELGSIHAITEPLSGGTVRIRMYNEYDAFGVEGYSNRPADQPLNFTGEPKDVDPQTDYMQLRARYYDPAIGRFVSRDPVMGGTTKPLSLNRYTYVENNGANKTDPSGLSSSRILNGCGIPIDVPSTANVDANVREAAKHKGDLLWFFNQVKPHGPWDYKDYNTGQYADFGNYQYGLIGHVIGVPEYILKSSAGVAQEVTDSYYKVKDFIEHKADLNQPKHGLPFIIPPFDDDPRDQGWIDQGFHSTCY